ncbi:hypothetical protein LINPERPRIM_LOCUS6559 [Linum perenne]
MVQDNLHK